MLLLSGKSLFGQETLDVGYLDAWAEFIGQDEAIASNNLEKMGFPILRNADGRHFLPADALRSAIRTAFGTAASAQDAPVAMALPTPVVSPPEKIRLATTDTPAIKRPKVKPKVVRRADPGSGLFPGTSVVDMLRKYEAADSLVKALNTSPVFCRRYSLVARYTKLTVLKDGLPVSSCDPMVGGLKFRANRGGKTLEFTMPWAGHPVEAISLVRWLDALPAHSPGALKQIRIRAAKYVQYAGTTPVPA